MRAFGPKQFRKCWSANEGVANEGYHILTFLRLRTTDAERRDVRKEDRIPVLGLLNECKQREGCEPEMYTGRFDEGLDVYGGRQYRWSPDVKSLVRY